MSSFVRVINSTAEETKIMSEDNQQQQLSIDEEKLARLKAKLAAKTKENEMATTTQIVKKEKSINFGIVGSGQAGSRLAETFYKLGYDAIVINTAQQDLKFIDVPESNKLHLNYGLGGAAKSLDFGKEAALAHREQISELINTQLADSQAIILVFSSGGGSGGGSCDVLIDAITATGKPIVVITTLPMSSDDAQTKHNAIEVMSNLTKMLQSKIIANLIIVDNAKLEAIYSDVGQMDFFKTANKAIVEPIDVFNTLSSMPSEVKALDPQEWSKMLLDGEGISIYSTMKVENYIEDTSLAEAIISNFDNSLLATGFDVGEAKYVGFIVAANSSVWKSIPASSINYALEVINDTCKSPLAVYKGVYTVDNPNDCVMVYTFLAGLSLPKARIDVLLAQSKELATNAKAKNTTRNLNLGLDTGKHETLSAVDKIKSKMAASKSNFSKFTNNIIDRRKK